MQQALPPETSVGTVALNVRDLSGTSAFYQDVIGLTLRRQEEGQIHLGTPQQDLVVLHATPEGRRAPGTTGLYHLALLVPTRSALAAALAHLAEVRWPLQGAADHYVSEALYLADPEGNGLELYRDRPQAQWPREGEQVRMGTVALDLKSLLDEAPDTDWSGLAQGTRLGHVHLRVDDTRTAEAFYVGVLGFNLMQRFGSQASFLSAGGYHHHVGVNSWESAGASPPPPGALGLRSYTIVLPDEAERTRLTEHLAAAGHPVTPTAHGPLLCDPSGNAFILATD